MSNPKKSKKNWWAIVHENSQVDIFISTWCEVKKIVHRTPKHYKKFTSKADAEVWAENTLNRMKGQPSYREKHKKNKEKEIKPTWWAIIYENWQIDVLFLTWPEVQKILHKTRNRCKKFTSKKEAEVWAENTLDSMMRQASYRRNTNAGDCSFGQWANENIYTPKWHR